MINQQCPQDGDNLLSHQDASQADQGNKWRCRSLDLEHAIETPDQDAANEGNESCFHEICPSTTQKNYGWFAAPRPFRTGEKKRSAVIRLFDKRLELVRDGEGRIVKALSRAGLPQEITGIEVDVAYRG